MRLARRLMILSAMSLSLVGCASKLLPVGIEYCLTASPIYFDSMSQVDDTPFAIQRQILEHNVTYERLCEQ